MKLLAIAPFVLLSGVSHGLQFGVDLKCAPIAVLSASCMTDQGGQHTTERADLTIGTIFAEAIAEPGLALPRPIVADVITILGIPSDAPPIDGEVVLTLDAALVQTGPTGHSNEVFVEGGITYDTLTACTNPDHCPGVFDVQTVFGFDFFMTESSDNGFTIVEVNGGAAVECIRCEDMNDLQAVIRFPFKVTESKPSFRFAFDVFLQAAAYNPGARTTSTADISIEIQLQPDQLPDGTPPLEVQSQASLTHEASPGLVEARSSVVFIDESSPSVTVPFHRLLGGQGAVSVDYSTVPLTATPGVDFTAVSGTLFWDAGEQGARTVTVPILNDETTEPSELFKIVLSNPTGGIHILDPESTVSIDNDDVEENPGLIKPSSYSVNVAEDAGSVLVALTRTGGTDGAVSVYYELESETPVFFPDAAVTADYAPATGSISWADGESGQKFITIDILDDSVAEEREVFSVALSNATNGAAIFKPSFRVVIFDDDRSELSGRVVIPKYVTAFDEVSVGLLPVARIGGNSGAASVVEIHIDHPSSPGIIEPKEAIILNWLDAIADTKFVGVSPLNNTLQERGPRVFVAALVGLSGTQIDPDDGIASGRHFTFGIVLDDDLDTTDSDGDGLPNGADADDDDDGLLDWIEFQYLLDPLNSADADADADGDGFSNRVEIAAGTDPNDATSTPPTNPNGDPDDDGLTNEVEDTLGTDPLDSDTDDDGFHDGDEVAWQTDPLVPNPCPDFICQGVMKIIRSVVAPN